MDHRAIKRAFAAVKQGLTNEITRVNRLPIDEYDVARLYVCRCVAFGRIAALEALHLARLGCSSIDGDSRSQIERTESASRTLFAWNQVSHRINTDSIAFRLHTETNTDPVEFAEKFSTCWLLMIENLAYAHQKIFEGRIMGPVVEAGIITTRLAEMVMKSMKIGVLSGATTDLPWAVRSAVESWDRELQGQEDFDLPWGEVVRWHLTEDDLPGIYAEIAELVRFGPSGAATKDMSPNADGDSVKAPPGDEDKVLATAKRLLDNGTITGQQREILQAVYDGSGKTDYAPLIQQVSLGKVEAYSSRQRDLNKKLKGHGIRVQKPSNDSFLHLVAIEE